MEQDIVHPQQAIEKLQRVLNYLEFQRNQSSKKVKKRPLSKASAIIREALKSFIREYKIYTVVFNPSTMFYIARQPYYESCFIASKETSYRRKTVTDQWIVEDSWTAWVPIRGRCDQFDTWSASLIRTWPEFLEKEI